MPTSKKAVTVYFDDALYERVVAAAKADRRSVANFIEAACDAVAPHQLGSRVMLASRIVPTLMFDEFRKDDGRTGNEYFVYATRGDDRRRFDIPRKLLQDHVGKFTAANAIEFCEQNRAKIEAACRIALSLAPSNDRPITLTGAHFQ
jgi:hypothetical protein